MPKQVPTREQLASLINQYFSGRPGNTKIDESVVFRHSDEPITSFVCVNLEMVYTGKWEPGMTYGELINEIIRIASESTD